jgi:type IV pilus assembly protein PilA
MLDKMSKAAERCRFISDAFGKRKQRDGEDSGFTLIELMVVLLIMAILLAIAIPTFLGVAKSANKKATQQDLNTAINSAHAVHSATGTYTANPAALVAALHSQTPGITWTTSATLAVGAEGKNKLAVGYVATNKVEFMGMDKTGGCWAEYINTTTTTTVPQTPKPGTSYYWVAAAPATAPVCTITTMIATGHLLGQSSFTTGTGKADK